MSNNELELYKKLQSFFKERMGEWQINDRYLWGKGVWHVTEENFDDFDDNDKPVYLHPDCLRIPLTIDTEQPERGLLGMLNTFYDLYTVAKDEWVVIVDSGRKSFEATTPTEAILKALIVQERL